MLPKHETDVIVAGAGPVGMICALDLARRGLRVEIVDEERRPASHSYALALHSRSIEILEELGLPITRHPYGLRVDTLGFYEGESRRAELALTTLGGRHPYILVLRQSHLERALEEALARHDVKVRWNHRVAGFEQTGEHVEVQLQRLDSVSTGYAVARSERGITKRDHHTTHILVGADGRDSLVRRTLDIPVHPAGDSLSFAVFEFQSGVDPGREVRVIVDDSTTSVMWPLRDGRCRWNFQLDAAEVPGGHHKSRFPAPVGKDYFPVLTEDFLQEMLATRAPWSTRHVGEIYWSTVVSFDPGVVEQFGKGRVWLAGDAAHVAGPVGIQSMNAGIREARDLAARIQRVLRGEATVSSLEEYGRGPAEDWRTLLGLDGTPAVKPAADEWVARRAARLVSCIPASGADLVRLGEQLGLDLARGGVAEAGSGAAAKA